jgi:23S rRNA maturation-related 3'-5' exoribonuclease YhaM
MVSQKKKEAVFVEELRLIFDRNIREFTRLCIISAPDYFFTDCPASSSGKYHPLDELAWDGTIIHTRKVFTTAYELCRGLGCEDNRDEILSACIIHDLRKQGIKRTGHTTKNHPDLGAKLVEEVYEATKIIEEESYKIIRDSVGYHYGLWSIRPWQKPLANYTMEELCVYLSDYIASKRCVDVNYKR